MIEVDMSMYRGRWQHVSSPQADFDFAQLKNVKVHAVVYYGRRHLVQILEIYLRRNLKAYGGVLDDVIFMEKAGAEDRRWLTEVILPSQPEYYKMMPMHDGFAYSFMKDNEFFFKIDDDTVFIEDGCFENMLAIKLKYPRYLFVSANVINHTKLSYLHNALGAVQKYDISTKNVSGVVTHVAVRNETLTGLSDFPMRPEWDAWGECSLKRWECAMIAHENFLWNFQHNNLDAYRFRLFDFHFLKNYERWSINSLLINGTEFVFPQGHDRRKRIPDDEPYVSHKIPEITQRHCVVSGYSILVHFHYGRQREGLVRTNLLERYLDIATTHYGPALPLELPAPHHNNSSGKNL
jgi:hypothetical protein